MESCRCVIGERCTTPIQAWQAICSFHWDMLPRDLQLRKQEMDRSDFSLRLEAARTLIQMKEGKQRRCDSCWRDTPELSMFRMIGPKGRENRPGVPAVNRSTYYCVDCHYEMQKGLSHDL